MKEDQIINFSQYKPSNSTLKMGLFAIIGAILLQGIVGCNPRRSMPSPIPSYTEPSTLIATLSKTNSSMKIPTSTLTLSPSMTPDLSHTIITRMTLRFDFNNNFDDSIEDKTKTYLDLDTMTTGDTPESDLHFFTTFGSLLWVWLDPINGANTSSRGKNKISLKDCFEEPYLGTEEDQDDQDAYAGNNICVVSNKSRIFLLYIEKLNIESTYTSINILITTYKL